MPSVFGLTMASVAVKLIAGAPAVRAVEPTAAERTGPQAERAAELE